MLSGESPRMHLEGDTGAAPLLESAPVLEADERAGVPLVHGNASGSSSVGSLVESPIGSDIPSDKCLVQGEVRLDPWDAGQLVAMTNDGTPEVGMLAIGPDTGIK